MISLREFNSRDDLNSLQFWDLPRFKATATKKLPGSWRPVERLLSDESNSIYPRIWYINDERLLATRIPGTQTDLFCEVGNSTYGERIRRELTGGFLFIPAELTRSTFRQLRVFSAMIEVRRDPSVPFNVYKPVDLSGQATRWGDYGYIRGSFI